MENISREWIHGKNVVVLGLAKSGLAVAGLLHRLGAQVTVNDQLPEERLTGVEELRGMGITVIAGGHPEGLIHQGIDLIVKNPGIPYSAGPVQEGLALGIPVITEVELAWQISAAPIIGITGSNGKTTTTTLVGKILEEADLRPIVAGNIGTVLCEKAETASVDEILVAELSSFQLKGTIGFRPHIACLLNIYPAHLDYHQTIEDYISSKEKLFANMKEDDIAVLNADNEACRQAAERISCRVIWFSRQQKVTAGTYIKDNSIYYLHSSGKEEKIISVHEIAMPGSHNLENCLAAAAICKSAGAGSEDIRKVLSTFAGVEHRTEFVAEVNGVIYYNDSKATNAQAAIKAIQSFDRPIVLIAGGLDRGTDFKEMVPVIKERVKAITAYGQTKDKFMAVGQAAGLKQLSIVDNVREAVRSACMMAEPGDIVLLSPACASWDMYSSFEERGRIFKESVHMLRTSLH